MSIEACNHNVQPQFQADYKATMSLKIVCHVFRALTHFLSMLSYGKKRDKSTDFSVFPRSTLEKQSAHAQCAMTASKIVFCELIKTLLKVSFTKYFIILIHTH